MKALNTTWSILRAVGGAVVGAVSIFGWLNVTPEMVGQTAYDALYVALPFLTFVGGAFAGWGITSLYYRKQLAVKDDGISKRKMRDSSLATFRMKFKDLGPEDMEWVARVYRAGGKGIEPSDAELVRFSNGVAIKEFLRLDAVAHKILLADGVGGMLDGCGDLVVYAMGIVCEQDVAKAEARATAAEAELAERDAEASRLAEGDRILHMDYLTKGLLYAIATGSEFTTRDDDPSYLSSNAKNLDAFQRLLRMGLANYRTCGMHELRWFGTELAVKLVEERADLFGEAKKEVEEIRRKEGTGSR